jgi:antitoxin component of RelBE/YafQ-DinJ toxin-antitoxin module
MVDRLRTMSKAEAAKVFHRVGLRPDQVAAVLAKLSDPIDFERDRAYLDSIGLTRDHLIDMMGGSP